jgi:hypothetical protein
LPVIILQLLDFCFAGDEVFPRHQGQGLPVFRAKGMYVMIQFMGEVLAESHGIKGLPAYRAANEIHGCDLVPVALQKVLEFYGLLGTNSPALAAPGT